MARELYEKQEWEDLPSENTPISGERLGHIEQGIYDNSANMALKEIYADNNINLAIGNSAANVGMKAIQHGINVMAIGNYSYARGDGAIAQGLSSCAEGVEVIAVGDAQSVDGRYNLPNPNYASMTGGGTSNSNRKNIRMLDWQGNVMYAGTVESQGLILTDTETGQKHKLTIANGDISITAVE